MPRAVRAARIASNAAVLSMRASLSASFDEEAEDVSPETQILRVVDQFTASPWARELDLHELGETRAGPARHQRDAVGEHDRLVDVVGHHEDGIAGFRPHPHQLVLDDAAG